MLQCENYRDKILFRAEISNFSLAATLSKLLYVLFLYNRKNCFGYNKIFTALTHSAISVLPSIL